VWVVALHIWTDPPVHRPSAPAEPQPTQAWPEITWFAVQVSAQVPAVVRQPPVPALQPATQHPPAPQVVGVAAQVQALHTSPVPLQ
jgi:hypothetical protein